MARSLLRRFSWLAVATLALLSLVAGETDRVKLRHDLEASNRQSAASTSPEYYPSNNPPPFPWNGERPPQSDPFDRLLIQLIKTMLPRAEQTSIDPTTGEITAEKITGMPKFSTIKTPEAINVVRNRNLVENESTLPEAILSDDNPDAWMNLGPPDKRVTIPTDFPIPGCGTSEKTPGDSCLAIKQGCLQPPPRSGPYFVTSPDGPVRVYCDMEEDGGGWTLIGKVAAGVYNVDDTTYRNMWLNPIEDVNPAVLTGPMPPDDGVMAWFNKKKTNDMYTKAQAKVVRVDILDCTVNPANNGRYFQKRMNPPDGWDFWHALRNSALWGDPTLQGSNEYVQGFGSSIKLTKGSNLFDSKTNDFAHHGDGSMGVWSFDTQTANDGIAYTVSRHCGLLCDGIDNQGWLWIMTCDRNESGKRYKNDKPVKSLIWLK